MSENINDLRRIIDGRLHYLAHHYGNGVNALRNSTMRDAAASLRCAAREASALFQYVTQLSDDVGVLAAKEATTPAPVCRDANRCGGEDSHSDG